MRSYISLLFRQKLFFFFFLIQSSERGLNTLVLSNNKQLGFFSCREYLYVHSTVWPSPSTFLHQTKDQINWLRKKKQSVGHF